MIYGVIGPKNFKGVPYDNFDYVMERLKTFTDMQKIVYGGGDVGLEALIRRYIEMTETDFEIVPPNIKRDKDAAWSFRDLDIIYRSDAVIAFWDGGGNITVDSLRRCVQSRKEATIIPMV